jgi:hypothetical protein
MTLSQLPPPVLPSRAPDATGNAVGLIREYLVRHCPYRSMLSDVEIAATDDAVVLSGRVSSYYVRQVVLVFARKAVPDVRIEDRLQVMSAD